MIARRIGFSGPLDRTRLIGELPISSSTFSPRGKLLARPVWLRNILLRLPALKPDVFLLPAPALPQLIRHFCNAFYRH